MRVFIAGGTGLIGTRLVRRLLDRGDQVVALSRSAERSREKLGQGPEIVEGDPSQAGPWMDRVAGCDAVVNLAGENLFAHRWSDEFKAVMRESRLKSTENVVEAIRRAGGVSPLVLVNGSAIGYYGFHGDEELTEVSGPGDDFLGKMAADWEQAASRVASAPGAHGELTQPRSPVRVVLLRTGVVMDKTGGALKLMMLPFKMFVGGKVGSGKQWISWVHHEDEVGIILFALDNPNVHGPINATAPNPVTNKQLAKALGHALHRPSFFPTPGFMLRVALGEVADVVTKGQRVLPKKALDLGYPFKYPEIEGALQQLMTS